MAITITSQPSIIHSSINENWWVFQSNLRFAPSFNLKLEVKESVTNNIFNTLLVPTNPSDYNVFNAPNVLNDYCLPDFNCQITAATISNCFKRYTINVSETFEGFYIIGTSSGGVVGNVDVVNNNTYSSLPVPIQVGEISFLGGTISTPISDIWVYSFATSSTTGFINRFTLSKSATASTGITASIGGGSPGFLTIPGYPIFSTGATLSTNEKWAVRSDFDYLDYNEADNFNGYISGNDTRKFLTRSPRELNIYADELATLSFIQSLTQSVTSANIVANTSATFSKTINIATASPRIDIPTGTKNLGITSSDITSYEVQLFSNTTPVSEKFKYNIICNRNKWEPMRLAWVNSLGGIDYWTFRFISSNRKNVSRATFEKNLIWSSTKEDRGITQYKTDDFTSWTCTSDLIPDDVSDWMSDLFTSDDVRWLRGTQSIPVQLTSDIYEKNVGIDNREIIVDFRLARSRKK